MTDHSALKEYQKHLGRLSLYCIIPGFMQRREWLMKQLSDPQKTKVIAEKNNQIVNKISELDLSSNSAAITTSITIVSVFGRNGINTNKRYQPATTTRLGPKFLHL